MDYSASVPLVFWLERLVSLKKKTKTKKQKHMDYYSASVPLAFWLERLVNLKKNPKLKNKKQFPFQTLLQLGFWA